MIKIEQLTSYTEPSASPDFLERCIIFLFSLYSFTNIMRVTQINRISGVFELIVHCNYLILGCLVVLLVYPRKIKHKAITGLILMLTTGLLVAWQGDTIINTLTIVLFIIMGTQIRTKSLFKLYWFIVSAVCIMTVSFCFLGIYKNTSSYVYNRGFRHDLGFNYTTYAPNFLFHASLVYFYIKKKITVLDTGIIMIFNIILMHYTDTRAAFWELTLLLLIMWIHQIFPKLFKTKLFCLASTVSMPALAGLMFFLTFTYKRSNKFLRILNELLSSRLSLGHRAMEKYGLPLFGTDVEWANNTVGYQGNYFYVDSSYINAIFTFGVVLTSFVIISFAILSYKSFYNGDTVLCIAILLLSIHSFSDPQLMELRYNPFLLLLGSVWLKTPQNLKLSSKGIFQIPSIKFTI